MESESEPRRSLGWRCLANLADHAGVASVYQSSLDVKLLIMQRFTRMFAYGASTLVLVSFLRALDISETKIGLFMTLTLVGDIVISFVLACYADAMGRRLTLLIGSALLIASGVVFALSSSYWVLLVAAIVGVISPSGNEIGPFRAVEESTIAQLTAAQQRGDVYAWYTLCGSAGAAFGTMVSGWAIQAALAKLDWQVVDIYRLVFYGYSGIGVVKTLLTLMLSPAVESEKRRKAQAKSNPGRPAEEEPLLPSNQESSETPDGGATASTLSSSGRKILICLCLLFGLDSLGSGLVPLSWIVHYFKSRFNLVEGSLGSIFFVTHIIAAGSTLVASSLAKRLGNVPTMVFTHIPSSVFLALIPVPSELHWALTLLILRSCIQSMDVAPRSAFLAAILDPAERTMSLGLVKVVQTTAQSIGPLITGFLVEHNYFWVSFLCAGCLKITYDLGLLALFKNAEHGNRGRNRAGEDGE
ncbi:major facilitator superfamily domain-containing protein [Stachybotrys elegans]|uniref:Major facilitator superfamily domain-containing protein n=1 Tax=Stachybotrys elegans TaxID=80388 RepID=A0A8K0SCQ6_9HYPO|nr:major facilitator superfamily domain-containing protein [Stachybotrys elegans]